MADFEKVSNEDAFDACINIVNESGYFSIGPIKINSMRLVSVAVMAMTLLMLHLYGFESRITNAAFGFLIISIFWTIQPTYETLLQNSLARFKDELSNIERSKRIKKEKLENFYEY